MSENMSNKILTGNITDFTFNEVTIEKSLCFSGHRSSKLLKSAKSKTDFKSIEEIYAVVQNEVLTAITEEGYTTFYHGACNGFDLMVADILQMQKNYISLIYKEAFRMYYQSGTDLEKFKEFCENCQKRIIKVIAVVPYPEQAKNWSDFEKALYDKYISFADEVVTISPSYKRGVFRLRNEYMVDRSSKLLAFCSESYGGTRITIDYAYQKEILVKNIFEHKYSEIDKQLDRIAQENIGNGFLEVF